MTGAVLLGFIDGLLVAVLGVGVVLVYKADRFVNLANAQLGVLSSLLLAKLVLDAGASWFLAFPPALALGLLVGAGCRRFVVSRIEGASRTSLMILTLGLSQLLTALAYFEWAGPDRARLRTDGYPLPADGLWRLGGLSITGRHLLIILVAPAAIVLLGLWLQKSSFGRLMRAAASNPDAARLAGIDTRWTSTVAWGAAGALSAVGAILDSPGQAVLELQMTGPTLLLVSLGAAALAGFTSLRGAVVAGIGLGIVDGVAAYVGRGSGAGLAAVFVTVLLGLLVRSAIVGPTEARDVQIDRSGDFLRIPKDLNRFWVVRWRLPIVALIALAGGGLLPLLPWLGEPHRVFVLAYVAMLALATLSLTVVSGWAGQVSLGQFAFVAIGAFTAARFLPRGWTLLATLIVAVAVGAIFGIAAGLPAARSRGLTFAVTSLGLAVVGPAWLFGQPWLGTAGTASVAPAYLAGAGRLETQSSVYFTTLAVLVLGAAGVARLRRSNAGRVVLAVRDNARAASTFGFSPAAVRVTTFAMSGALAASAGVLWLAVNRNISPASFGPDLSLLLFSAAVMGGVGSIAGAILGCIAVFGFPLLFADVLNGLIPDTEQMQLLLAGAGLVQTQLVLPGGIASVFHRRVQERVDRFSSAPRIEAFSSRAIGAAAPSVERSHPGGRADAEARFAGTDMVLRVEGLRVVFGEVVAVDGVSLRVAAGEIVGVIGANGAGKTSLLDALSGLTPASGRVELCGHDVGSLTAAARARLGVSRGFQDARLFPALTVREAIELACARRYPTGPVGTILGAPWVRLAERAVAGETEDIIRRFGLTAMADMPGDRLSTGTRHIWDLAAQVATQPRLMILDEPTSGLAQRETEALTAVIREIAGDLGCAILLVEHDMPFVMAVADRIYCLDAGAVIAEDTPAVMRKDPVVIASYLGSPLRRPVGAKRRRAR